LAEGLPVDGATRVHTQVVVHDLEPAHFVVGAEPLGEGHGLLGGHHQDVPLGGGAELEVLQGQGFVVNGGQTGVRFGLGL